MTDTARFRKAIQGLPLLGIQKGKSFPLDVLFIFYPQKDQCLSFYLKTLLSQPSFFLFLLPPITGPLLESHPSTDFLSSPSCTPHCNLLYFPASPSSPASPPSPPAGCACCHIQGYVGDAWNVFDALVVIGSVVDIILSQVERRQYVELCHSLFLLSNCYCHSPFFHPSHLFSFLTFLS